jgi:hypothetical protein
MQVLHYTAGLWTEKDKEDVPITRNKVKKKPTSNQKISIMYKKKLYTKDFNVIIFYCAPSCCTYIYRLSVRAHIPTEKSHEKDEIIFVIICFSAQSYDKCSIFRISHRSPIQLKSWHAGSSGKNNTFVQFCIL